ncbi:MAG: hypothetical protein ACOX4X_02940 [Aminobacterium colombiense]|jgi:hypothetical protein|uniref:hypothetical protein n=1 Tax=Aminobacterium colombiense TaxID=81468 RepID=UPI003D993DBA
MGKIDSLCMVLLKEDGSTKQLYRLADLENGAWGPIKRDEEGIDREILYYSPSFNLPDKTIAVFSWEPFYDNGYKQNIIISNYNWVEVIYKTDYELSQIIEEIRAGVAWANRTHDLLVIFDEAGAYYLALFWPQKEMELMQTTNVLKSKSTTKYLNIFKIDKRHINSCAENTHFNDNRYYYSQLKLLDNEAINKKFFFSPEKIINDIVYQHIKKFSNLSRKKCSKIKDVLNNVGEASILDGISSEFGCDLDEAKQYYEKYIDVVQKVISVNEGNGALFQNLIENNSVLSERFISEVEANWRKKKQKTVEELNQLKERILHQENILVEQDKKITEKENLIKELEQIEQETCEKIRSRLGKARSEVSTLLEEYAFLLPTENKTLHSDVVSNDISFLVASKLSQEQANEEEGFDDIQYDLAINLGEAGVSDNSIATELAQFLISAYYNRVNLLLAGIGGLDIVLALNAVFCNSAVPAYLNLSVNISMAEACNFLKESNDQIIVIPNALNSKNLDKVLLLTELFPKKMFIFLSPFSQSLTIEPDELYQYMLPLFTEFYISKSATKDYIWGSAQQVACKFSINAKNIAKARSEILNYTSILLLREKQKNQIARIKAGIDQCFRKSDSLNACLRALFIPLSLCLGCAEDLLNHVKGDVAVEETLANELEIQIERNN